MKIYVGNFDSSWDDARLKKVFSIFGTVVTATVIMDLFNGKSRGFGYVVMPHEAEALTAIDTMNNSTVESCTLEVRNNGPEREQNGSYKVGEGSVNPYRFKKN